MAHQEVETTEPGWRRNEMRHTTPWMADELVYVDGQPLVYTYKKTTGITVRFHGGRACSVDVLRAMGHIVVMPRVLRTNDVV